MTFAALASGLALVFVHHVAPADDGDFSKRFVACMEQSGGVRAPMLGCISAETARLGRRRHQSPPWALSASDMLCRMGMVPWVAVMLGNGLRRDAIEDPAEWSRCADKISVTGAPARDP
jgi:hypothetical protein